MEVINRKEGIPLEHYLDRFSRVDPAEVVARCGIEFSAEEGEEGTGQYTLALLGTPVTLQQIAPPLPCPTEAESEVFGLQPLRANEKIFLLRYLVEGGRASHSGADGRVAAAGMADSGSPDTVPGSRDSPQYARPSDPQKFIDYTEAPWGNVYARQFDGRVRQRLAFTFGRDIDGFIRRVSSIDGALRLDRADAAFRVPFLGMPRRPRSGDEPQSAGALFQLEVMLYAADDEFPPSAQLLFSDNFPAAFTAEDMAVAGEIFIQRVKAMPPTPVTTT